MSKRVLVAGIGNVFFGDDAFGVEVVRRLASRPLPDGVRVVEFGIRGIDLAFSILDGYDAVLLVDAVRSGDAPGTLQLIEASSPDESETSMSGHELTPARVLSMVRAFGGVAKNVMVLGCEPERLGTEDEPAIGLSSVVEDAANRAVSFAEEIIGRLYATQAYEELG